MRCHVSALIIRGALSAGPDVKDGAKGGVAERYRGGANFLFADGDVRFPTYSADSAFPAMGTRNGGEVFTMW